MNPRANPNEQQQQEIAQDASPEGPGNSEQEWFGISGRKDNWGIGDNDDRHRTRYTPPPLSQPARHSAPLFISPWFINHQTLDSGLDAADAEGQIRDISRKGQHIQGKVFVAE